VGGLGARDTGACGSGISTDLGGELGVFHSIIGLLAKHPMLGVLRSLAKVEVYCRASEGAVFSLSFANDHLPVSRILYSILGVGVCWDMDYVIHTKTDDLGRKQTSQLRRSLSREKARVQSKKLRARAVSSWMGCI
jgi:hypothetical protein